MFLTFKYINQSILIVYRSNITKIVYPVDEFLKEFELINEELNREMYHSLSLPLYEVLLLSVFKLVVNISMYTSV